MFRIFFTILIPLVFLIFTANVSAQECIGVCPGGTNLQPDNETCLSAARPDAPLPIQSLTCSDPEKVPTTTTPAEIDSCKCIARPAAGTTLSTTACPNPCPEGTLRFQQDPLPISEGEAHLAVSGKFVCQGGSLDKATPLITCPNKGVPTSEAGSCICRVSSCRRSVRELCPDGKTPAPGIAGMIIGRCSSGDPINQNVWGCDSQGTCPSAQNDSCTCVAETSGACLTSEASFCKNNPDQCSSAGGQVCNLAKGGQLIGAGVPAPDQDHSEDRGVYTAIGCVPSEPRALVEGLLKYGILASGGIAFLVMLLAALEMITAEGNPETLKNARDKFYSAIIGLLLIVFSVLLMQIIGLDILGLPGFSGTNPLPPGEIT